MKNNFAYFIASYGKPEKIPTFEALKKLGAKYPIFIVVGDDDPKLAEYRLNYTNLIVFNKNSCLEDIDQIGSYAKTHKVCTYSRIAIQTMAESLQIKYVGYLFDDINNFTLRYNNGGKISSVANFNIDDIMDMYIELLESSEDIYIVGPPQSSFYIGVSVKSTEQVTARYGNMFVYDSTKDIGPYKASTIEDMSIVIYNNMVGKLSICPFGLQVNCRDPHITEDSYCGMSKSEYYQQWSIIFNGATINVDKPQLPYKRFQPKIISAKYRKEVKNK